MTKFIHRVLNKFSFKLNHKKKSSIPEIDTEVVYEFPKMVYAELKEPRSDRYHYEGAEIIANEDLESFTVKYPTVKKIAIYKLEKIVNVTYPPTIAEIIPDNQQTASFLPHSDPTDPNYKEAVKT